MKQFLNQGASLFDELRQALEYADPGTVADILDRQETLDETLRRWSRNPSAIKVSSREVLELRELLDKLRGQAFICARLARSQAQYLRWALGARRPEQEYTSEGTLAAGGISASTKWEA